MVTINLSEEDYETLKTVLSTAVNNAAHTWVTSAYTSGDYVQPAEAARPYLDAKRMRKLFIEEASEGVLARSWDH